MRFVLCGLFLFTINRFKDWIKETYMKKSASQVKIFIDFAFKTYAENMGYKLRITGGKDGMLAKRLLNVYSIEELQQYWLFFLEIDDYFIANAGRTIPIFSNQINKVITQYSVRQNADRMAYKPSYHLEMT